MQTTSEGVTVVVVRTVFPGRQAECEVWMHDIAQVATTFPGHLGVTIFRPRPGARDYTLAFRFDTAANLERWEQSPERRAWVERADAFTERVYLDRQSGLETWFVLPGVPVTMPTRWKMMLVTWLVAFALIQLLSLAAAPAI